MNSVNVHYRYIYYLLFFNNILTWLLLCCRWLIVWPSVRFVGGWGLNPPWSMTIHHPPLVTAVWSGGRIWPLRMVKNLNSSLNRYKLLSDIIQTHPQKILFVTRNAFCGTWYLPNSHVNNERTVPVIMAGCTAHARNGRISTSRLKSDVTIVFPDPDFLYDAQIWAIRP